MKKLPLLLLVLALALAGCAKEEPAPPVTTQNLVPTQPAPPDSPGTRTVYICTSQTMSSGGSVTRTDYILDDKNQVRQVAIYTNGQETMRYDVESDAHGNYVRWVSGDIVSTYSYDQQGRLLLTSFYTGDVLTGSDEQIWTGELLTARISRNGSQEQRMAYFYNENGQKIREEFYQNSVLNSYSHLTLNQDGRAASQEVFLADGTLYSTVTYDYDGTTVTATTQQADGAVQQRTQEVWDEYGNLVSTTVFDADGNVLSQKTATWIPVEVPANSRRASI